MQNIIITKKGQELITKMIAGTSTVSFTKICTSDYDYSGTTLEEITELYNIKQTVPVSKVSRIDAMIVEILAAVDNSQLTESYYIRCLGLYAKDAEENEVLYGISVEYANPDYMPAFEGKTASGISFRLNTKVNNSEQVILEVNSATTPTMGQVEQLQQQIDEIKNNLNGGSGSSGLEFYVDDNGILTVVYDDGN